jgi:NACHT domain
LRHRWVRVAGWGLLLVALVLVAIFVPAGALRAHDEAGFNQWTGWATIAGLPVAVVGVALVLWEKISTDGHGPGIAENAEEDLAAVILAQAAEARSRLIGINEAGDEPANVRFIREPGRFREVGGAREGELDTVLVYYQSLSPQRLVILGAPGAGKTVLALELQIQLLEQRLHNPGTAVPVLINAASYDTGMTWERWLTRHLALRYAVGIPAAASLVRNGRILPIIDGLDEVDPAGTPQRAHVLVKQLNSWVRGRERAPLVVTCRRGGYRELLREIDRATHVEMIPLTSGQAANYLQQQFLNPDEARRWEPALADLAAQPDGRLAAQLATPWRLTLALAAFRDGGDPATLLPAAAGVTSSQNAEFADSLLLGSYIPAAVNLHGAPRRYSSQQVQHWLTVLAEGLAWQARHKRSATDIQLDTWWRPAGQWITRLVHVVLAAIPFQLWLVAGALSGYGALAFLILFLGMAAFAALNRHPRRLNFREIATRRGILRLAVGLLPGLAFGVLIAIEDVGSFGIAGSLALAAVIGLIPGAAAGLILGIGSSSPQAVSPRDIIRKDGRFGLVYGLTFGLLGALLYVLTISFDAGENLQFQSSSFPLDDPFSIITTGLDSNLFGVLGKGLIFGLSLGFTVGIARGAGAWVRYHIAVGFTALRCRGPLRFDTFLDWAQHVGLLRVSGVTYQFRHRQLQDWLLNTGAYPRNRSGGDGTKSELFISQQR